MNDLYELSRNLRGSTLSKLDEITCKIFNVEENKMFLKEILRQHLDEPISNIKGHCARGCKWKYTPFMPNGEETVKYAIGIDLFSSINYFTFELIELNKNQSRVIDHRIYLMTESMKVLKRLQFFKLICHLLNTFIDGISVNLNPKSNGSIAVGLSIGLPLDIGCDDYVSVSARNGDFRLKDFYEKNLWAGLKELFEKASPLVAIKSLISSEVACLSNGYHRIGDNHPELELCIGLVANINSCNIAFLDRDKQRLEKLVENKKFLLKIAGSNSYCALIDCELAKVKGTLNIFTTIQRTLIEDLMHRTEFNLHELASCCWYPVLIPQVFNYLYDIELFSSGKVDNQSDVINSADVFRLIKLHANYNKKMPAEKNSGEKKTKSKIFKEFKKSIQPIFNLKEFNDIDLQIVIAICNAVTQQTAILNAIMIHQILYKIYSYKFPKMIIVSVCGSMLDIVGDFCERLHKCLKNLIASSEVTIINKSLACGAALAAAAAVRVERANAKREVDNVTI